VCYTVTTINPLWLLFNMQPEYISIHINNQYTMNKETNRMLQLVEDSVKEQQCGRMGQLYTGNIPIQFTL